MLIIRSSEMDSTGIETNVEAASEYILNRFDDLGREGWEPWCEALIDDIGDSDILGIWYFKQWVTE